jgi:hypothetical protein
MTFTGAPNVIHMSPGGAGTKSGTDWANAVAKLTDAIGKVLGGKALILIAPGLYQDVNARATLFMSNLRIQGAGPGTVLEATSNADLITVVSNNIEFADLTLINSSSQGDGSAIVYGAGQGPQPTENRVLAASVQKR